MAFMPKVAPPRFPRRVKIEDFHAGMAELADAHGSGPCESNFMQVQVLLPAPSSVFNELKVKNTRFFMQGYIPRQLLALFQKRNGSKTEQMYLTSQPDGYDFYRYFLFQNHN